jgi:uroporphyrinogen decarboxylase
MIGLDIFDKHFAPRYKKYFDMVHSYGARTMMHMCGCVRKFLPRLIEIGLDVQDVVQPTTPEMDIEYLQKHYGKKLVFCGSVCVQTTIAFGTAGDVEREVNRRLKLFPKGGLFLGPTHAIQVGSPLENVLALYRTAGSLAKKIDASILGAGESAKDDGKINMSKLF